MVEDIENPFGAGGGLLRDGNDAAHRVEAQVEPADVGQEGSQYADGDFVFRDLPDAEGPHDQQSDLGEQGDGRRKQRPDLVDLVVDLEIVRVGCPETRRFATFLREGFDHADAGDGVRQHVGDFGPDAVDALEAGTKSFAHDVDQPGDDRQRQQCDQRQPRIDRNQDEGRHGDHQHIGDEIEEMQ